MNKTDAWMPLHIAAYVADTMRLTTLEHGAYLLLMMDYWRHGPLADDDRQLAAIAKVERRVWNRLVGPSIRGFFTAEQDGRLHQKRLDSERKRASDLSAKRSLVARKKNGPLSVPENTSKKPDFPIGSTAGGEHLQSVCTAFAHGLHAPLSRDLSSLRSEIQKVPELRSRCEAQARPEDAQRLLWSEGVATLRCLTKSDAGPARGQVGKLLKRAGKDHAAVLAMIRRAEIEQPDDALAWITAGLKGGGGKVVSGTVGCGDDPWGINAWISRQPDVKDGDVGGQTRKTINGWAVGHYAERLAEAAGLPEGCSVNWDCLGRLLRDDLGAIDEKPVLDAVRGQASRMEGAISSIAVFDATIRGAVARCHRRWG